jgi:hypothetical protein
MPARGGSTTLMKKLAAVDYMVAIEINRARNGYGLEVKRGDASLPFC